MSRGYGIRRIATAYLLAVFFLVLVILVSVTTVDQSGAASSANDETVIINIGDNYFSPTTISVPVGAAVQWSNQGRSLHNVTPDSGRAFGASIAPQTQYTAEFLTAGNFAYYCTLHGASGIAHHGTIVVRAQGESASVEIKTKGAVPEQIVVRVGENLQWINKSKTKQKLAFSPPATGVDPEAVLRRVAIAPKAEYSFRFATPGSYSYRTQSASGSNVGSAKSAHKGVVRVIPSG